jgi:hypothetical protein
MRLDPMLMGAAPAGAARRSAPVPGAAAATGGAGRPLAVVPGGGAAASGGAGRPLVVVPGGAAAAAAGVAR